MKLSYVFFDTLIEIAAVVMCSIDISAFNLIISYLENMEFPK